MTDREVNIRLSRNKSPSTVITTAISAKGMKIAAPKITIYAWNCDPTGYGGLPGEGQYPKIILARRI